ncbi:MAG: hypothetical protein JSW66_18375 [Phycisphaerales bacterium]|nr:MAG: hypothetical protein JSW66_18375 [Phycisphaerales bacterium]
MLWPRTRPRRNRQTSKPISLIFCAALLMVVCHLGSPARARESGPDIYVPYEDLAHLIKPADRAVLMGRAEFEALLAAAEAAARDASTIELGQVLQARYAGEVEEDRLTLTGTLEVVSLGRGPVAVPLAFGQVGLTQVLLDGRGAPLGYDKRGRLTLIITNKGSHRLEVKGTAKLRELSSGGMQFGLSLPAAVAGNMALSAPGDLEIAASVPVSESRYDKQADRTSVELTLGGQGKVTVILLGNGRRQEKGAILLGESAATVHLTRSHQELGCLYTVQALRQGVREVRFHLPSEWTITEVTCPNLVRWSIDTAQLSPGRQTLTVRLRSEKAGTTGLHIRASALRKGDAWRAPRVMLVGASYQRGYVLVNTDEELSVRAEQLTDARREDVSAGAPAPRMVSPPSSGAAGAGRLYFHWGDRWSARLELAEVELRRSIKERQTVSVSPQRVTLTGDFEVTAIGRELFEMPFVLGGPARQWQIKTVQVDSRTAGFEHRVEESGPGSRNGRLLTIELPRPIRPEKVANVTIELQHVPSDWYWPSDAAARSISVPLIRHQVSPSEESRMQTVSGEVLISAVDDLDALPEDVPEALEAVPVGRMASLGIERSVQYAYSYNTPAPGQIQFQVSRRRPRTSADAVGLITVGPREFTGHWRITYAISRASARRLYLLADKSLGQEIKITSPTVLLSSRSIVVPDARTISLSAELARRYDVWLLNLDRKTIGEVAVHVRYERPRTSETFDIPLVRPTCEGQINEQLAIQASEELALAVSSAGAKEIDAVDLPPLPVEAGRVLAAFRMDAPTTETGSGAAVQVRTAVHENYEIPSALAISAELTTFLDVQGGQRTEARFNIANASQQFLTIGLPDGAQLWSLRLGDEQAKPQQGAAGTYQVALGPLGKPVGVKIVYAYQPGRSNLERLELGGVELPGVEINQMNWTVVPPPDYSVTTQVTRMRTHGLIEPTPAYKRLYDVLLRSRFVSPVLTYRHAQLGKSYYAEELAESRRAQIAPGDVLYHEYEGEMGGMDRKGTMGGYGGGMAGIAPPAAPPERATPSPAKPAQGKPATQKALSVRTLHKGRFTLPVDLVPTPGAGPAVRFKGLGPAELVVGLTSRSRQTSWWTLGLVLVAAIGVVLARKRATVKAGLIVAVLSAASLSALWLPATASFANGAFTAGVCLVLFYALVWLARGIWSRLFLAPGPVMAVVLLALLVSTAQSTASEANSEIRQNAPIAAVDPPPVVIPYTGDPGTAEEADKVLVPYARFVELWNQAYPQDAIDWVRAETQISLADVRYRVTVSSEQLNLVLTAQIETHGADWSVLALPISSLAVTRATFAGLPAQLQTGPKGMVLMLPGQASGKLELHAVAKPEYLGRRGSAALSLPPLPAAVMTVVLPEADLELEVEQIEAVPAKRIVNGSVEYTFGLGMARTLTLRWLPKMAGSTADRTLSANAQHDVHAFHWATVGVSKITYSFSSGQYDRFALLMPQGMTLTELEGTNVRDFRDVGESAALPDEGKPFRLIEVRLHRPTQKQYELTVRWLSPHADGGGFDFDEPVELPLLRAGAVSRESGTVTLHAAGGMSVKVTKVTGGRRADITAPNQPQGINLPADRARPVARYYWPYRPFALFVELSRLAVTSKVRLNQLVRINTDRVELLVQANLKAEQGKLFGAGFILPEGYELLSAVGPAVANFYERSSEEGKFVHIMFHGGQAKAQLALMLLRKDAELDSFDVPAVMYLDEPGRPLAGQQGRMAVQVAASLEAETAASQNLKSISPATLRDWLDERTVNSVQFAYRYEAANPSLRLTIRRLPTTIRAEVFAGLVVRTTAAAYTYRLRYNITGSPVDHLSFLLPSEYARLVSANSRALRSVTQSDAGNGRTRWTVALVNEVTGIVDVVVNFALPIDPSTSTLQIPPLAAETASEYRAVVALQNMSRHEISVRDSTNLSDLAASEQQRLMPHQMRESLQYVFQSFEEDWSLNLEFKPAKTATRIQAVVDLLEVTTVVDRGGRCRYEAKVALQNRSEQFLQVKVPPGLRLWSANVAGQPVKPVMAEDSSEAGVLIPLVKTSPGGLPYDVYFYLADDGAAPLVTPLNGITRLKPPSLLIVGIPVMQTTWSLRLPGGYRYIRPGGNMSPVAGTVEVLSLGIEAKLEQLKRLERTYRDVAGSSVRKEQIAKSNWEAFNRKLAADIGQAQSYLASRRGQVSEDDYRRLNTKLDAQRQQQAGLLGSNTVFVRKQQEQARQDLNVFLNVDASNAGVAEIVRNEALLEKPEFLSKSEEQQIARLEQELELSQEQLKLLEQHKEGLVGADEDIREDDTKAAGTKAGELIVKFKDKEAEMGRTLDQLARDTAAQIDQKQAQIRGQLDELKDSRLQRHFQASLGKMLALRPEAEPQGQRRVAGPGLGVEAEEAAELAGGLRGGLDQAYEFRTARTDLQPYTARGTYSLPVSLPEGEVRLDFARPSGEAELSLWAVPVRMIHKLYGTIAILAALLAILALVKIWPQPQSRQPTSARRIIGYALLFVALSLALGISGVLISLVVIVLCEARRGAFVPAGPGPHTAGTHQK